MYYRFFVVVLLEIKGEVIFMYMSCGEIEVRVGDGFSRCVVVVKISN